MGNRFYLLNISVSGIKCIKEKVRLDFYKKTVDKNFNPEKYRVKAIYGENGSGKSALITAVKIFQDLILDDNYLNESKTQGFLDEMINKATRTFQFECEFLVDFDKIKLVYCYTVHIGKSKNGLFEIQYENLKWKRGNYANNKYEDVFESKNGELLYVNCIEQEVERVEKKTANLLSTHTFLYLYALNLNGGTMPRQETDKNNIFIHTISFMMLAVVLQVYIAEEDQHELYFLQKKLKESGSDQQVFMEEFFGYNNSLNMPFSVSERFVDKEYYEKYKERVGHLAQFLKIFKPNLVSIDIDAKENGYQYVCDLNLNYGYYVINKEFESTGIKKLIRLFDCFMSASTGGIVFVDEMDANLNDVYLCKLIEYFMYYGKGQLCFTTHNLGPMGVLKENRNAIDFLSSDNHLVPWTSRGNATPENCYRNGMIEDLPFNIEASDFVGIFGE